ncbi:hypothetical protein [Ileibacterium valens]|uniref:hypothetical protein n=1 Tax=Ileibacterium valens TaxID=1862668 RepID=UPI0009F9E7E3|nr:hypothetical protein [Ileibacterium valens]
MLSSNNSYNSVYELLIETSITGRSEDTATIISKCLLNHFDQIPDYSLTELSELCHVSCATLSRFIRQIGMENHLEFRNRIQQEIGKYPQAYSWSHPVEKIPFLPPSSIA